MRLTKKDVGCKFNTDSDLAPVVTCVHSCTGDGVFLFEDAESRSVMLTASDGYSLKCGSNITSLHDPRSWLSQMPNLGDIKDGWIACDCDDAGGGDGKDWFWFDHEPRFKFHSWSSYGHGVTVELNAFNMPELFGDQWKDSKISVTELKQWQVDNS